MQSEPIELGHCNKAFYITPETLENKLLYDDVFVDYFNVFLQLKAFEIPMRYEKLDGFYLEDPKPSDPGLQEVVDDCGKFYWQAAIASWVKEHRLPQFLRSSLFLEFKLCKLLLRKLLDNSRMAQSRLGLRGYSQADSPPPVLPPCSNTPVGHVSLASWPRKVSAQHHERPLWSACSLPAMLTTALETRLELLEGPPNSKINGNSPKQIEGQASCTDASPCKSQFDETKQLHGHDSEDIFDDENFVSRAQIARSAQSRRVNSRKRRVSLLTPSFDKRGDSRRSAASGRRTRSAPVEGGVPVRTSHCDLFLDYYEPSLQFDEDADTIIGFNDQEDDGTEADLQSIVDETKRNFQEMKEDALGSTVGMKNFRDFLKGTSGIHLFHFWIDVERYKDLEESNGENEQTLQLLRINLFRKINDKYKNYLTTEAKQKLTEALNHDGLTKDLFTRTQYDMLRRLRSYWIPRFLVHHEKTKDWRTIQDREVNDSRCVSSLSFLPAISIVHSLPPRGDWCTEMARRSCDWSKNLILTNRRVRSPLKRISSTADGRSDYEKFVDAISCEKESGWPFRCFLDRVNKKVELANLLFWQSIEDLKNDENRECDRHFHLCNAWSIVKRFLSDEAEGAVDLNVLEKQSIIERLRKTIEVSSSLFKSGQNHALVMLRSPWEEYIKDDRETLMKSTKIPSGYQSASGSRNDNKHGLLYHNFFSTGKWYPRYPESSPSERQRRLHTALTIAENIQATRMSLRSPQKSQASTTKGKSGTKTPKTKSPSKPKGKSRQVDHVNKNDVEKEVPKTPEKPPPDFTDVLDDKATMTAFKHYIQNTEGRHAMNNLAMYLDIESYLAIPQSKRTEKTQLATQIFKEFFDKSSRKNVELPARIPYQVENQCPSSPTLHEAQQHILPDINTSFQEFYKCHEAPKQVAEPNTTQAVHKSQMNKSETATNNPASLPVYYYKRRRNKFKGPGRLPPTKEDKQSLVEELRGTYGTLSVRLELFRRYLDSNDDVQPGHVSKLENDLFFYVEVQKFKDLFQYMDDMTVIKKADAIVDCFLDSATPPSVQIDISSDLAGRIVHKAQSFHTRVPRDQRDAQIFDDAQSITLKELVPFWAGFTRQFDSQSKERAKLPPTRREIIVKRRYSEFKKFPLNKRPTNLRNILPDNSEPKRELNFTIAEGLAWKEARSGETDSMYSTNVRETSTRSDTRQQSLAIS